MGYQLGVQMAGLDSVDYVVLVMLENRSFDHMLGFLYPKSGDFEGLDGTESKRRRRRKPSEGVPDNG